MSKRMSKGRGWWSAKAEGTSGFVSILRPFDRLEASQSQRTVSRPEPDGERRHRWLGPPGNQQGLSNTRGYLSDADPECSFLQL